MLRFVKGQQTQEGSGTLETNQFCAVQAQFRLQPTLSDLLSVSLALNIHKHTDREINCKQEGQKATKCKMQNAVYDNFMQRSKATQATIHKSSKLMIKPPFELCYAASPPAVGEKTLDLIDCQPK